MPRLLSRQEPPSLPPERDVQPLDALVVDGYDSTAAHRARIRALNAARQAEDAAREQDIERRRMAAYQAAMGKRDKE